MFQYFPGNYVWNLSVNLAMEMGARIGEVDVICKPLLEAAQRGEDAGTAEFTASWERQGDVLVELAAEDEAAGRLRSAGEKLGRAATYFLTGERVQAAGHAPRVALYAKFRETFERGVRLAGENAERVQIPYAGAHLSGILTRALNPDGTRVQGPAPLLVQVNGLDSTKEMLYRTGPGAKLAARGVSTLSIDQPGTGEALRLHEMHAVPEAEQWAGPVYEFLAAREDVDAGRIGLLGVSLGGYYAPRAVAFEPRFALGVAWGANHDWRAVQKARREREGERPVPHYWEHVRWVWGAEDLDGFFEVAERVHLDGVLDRVRVPFLVTHGEHDRQIPLAYAHRTYEQLVNSPDRELVVFTDRTGGTAHSSVDNGAVATDLIADWVAERLGGRTE
ncbi:prolyl oligopeptidase family serine peptidase [Paenibacillus sp. TRM 82003]|uniref:alpha/beta hydrolase family protein n=1 Tax=Kineococcus sp. TRM81007 TaxID=2925831 RepID=UPI001F5A1852|nr:prolyl oligopeptidase family serine peptidase [Kineococcus sp. TRM81007]MCI2240422.1 prolyl oligopeptidase family serine peptidase [Kineococcus sp. TRM81007]MCI3927402.1 prolyl oligopeptidase family serine peptidase [Paenibacillus sp. TRM 82003]